MRDYLYEKRLQAEVGLLCAMRRMKAYAGSLVKDERGDTNFVAIIIIIVILLAIAAIFKDKLTAAVNAVFEKLTNFINSDGGGIAGGGVAGGGE